MDSSADSAMRVWRMHQRAQIKLNADDRAALAAVVANRNSAQKHLWRAKIVLLTADGHGTAEIMQPRAGFQAIAFRSNLAVDELGLSKTKRSPSKRSTSWLA
jgi:hypothetical protein